MRENFDKHLKKDYWFEQQKFTIHRQEQLADIFKQYGGEKIPFTHFTREIDIDSSKRNKYVFPVVLAYNFSILKIEGDYLIKPKGLILGEKDFTRNEAHWC